MPSAPLFVADTATLQARLRLTGLPSGADGTALLQEAMTRVRAGFYRRLGVSRVDTILETDFEDDPVSAEEVLRSSANSAEVRWTYIVLLDLMPTLFMDASGATQETWNTEGAFRQGRPSPKAIQALKDELEIELDYLAGVTSDAGLMRSATIEAEEEPQDPGDSLYRPDLVVPDEELNEGEGS
jgi:hypothetical protein